jgi:2-dehydro-3-deoxyphosphogluconate aldolase/(4S)-4-hydroxy-2-oxoglutarate aldolase
MTTPFRQALARLRIVPVIVIDRPEDAWPVAQALKAGGLPCAEITFRTAGAVAAMREIARDPDIMLGAGTVLRAEQVDEALDAGAMFVVSPGLSADVVRRCQTRGVPVLPGVATATEILHALDAGIDVVKFFPAEAMGGHATVRALAAAYGTVGFVPTGGVTADNAGTYFSLPSVVAVGGSWMVPPSLVAAGRFDEITALTRHAVLLGAGARSS